MLYSNVPGEFASGCMPLSMTQEMNEKSPEFFTDYSRPYTCWLKQGRFRGIHKTVFAP